MKFTLIIMIMFLFTACAHYGSSSQPAFIAGQAASDTANASMNAAASQSIFGGVPAGMP